MASERLQKIMAACGVASRRKAEEMIASGRVTLNGAVVTELGTKADAERDQICVDGEPLKGPERLLYFLLHKPKGYVSTVSDPEGRLTVMELMKKCPERVYPVGRLDYSSEGLLLMTNDGALAQKRVKASPAKIRLVEDGANPWYEVILIEGRNRQIRRMFQRVGFNVEKIRRVRLGPLVLDVPPGKFRELTKGEVNQLKKWNAS